MFFICFYGFRPSLVVFFSELVVHEPGELDLLRYLLPLPFPKPLIKAFDHVFSKLFHFLHLSFI